MCFGLELRASLCVVAAVEIFKYNEKFDDAAIANLGINCMF